MEKNTFEIQFDTEFPLVCRYINKKDTTVTQQYLFTDKDTQKQILFEDKSFCIYFIQKSLALELLGGLDNHHKLSNNIIALKEWLEKKFTPCFIPTKEIFMVRKEFPSKKSFGTYTRYSIIQKYHCKNLDEFLKVIRRFFPKEFFVKKQFLYTQLLVGSSDREEPESRMGIPIRDEDFFQNIRIEKIPYSNIKNKTYFIKKLKKFS